MFGYYFHDLSRGIYHHRLFFFSLLLLCVKLFSVLGLNFRGNTRAQSLFVNNVI